MKTVFIIKGYQGSESGYYDGEFNFANSPYDAKAFETYQEAEQQIRELISAGIGSLMQIDKMFAS